MFGCAEDAGRARSASCFGIHQDLQNGPPEMQNRDCAQLRTEEGYIETFIHATNICMHARKGAKHGVGHVRNAILHLVSRDKTVIAQYHKSPSTRFDIVESLNLQRFVHETTREIKHRLQSHKTQ
jgi:hypothetical protein